MNPIFMVTIFSSLFKLKRTCPQCNKSQAITSGQKHKTIRCKFCGAEIPPRKP